MKWPTEEPPRDTTIAVLWLCLILLLISVLTVALWGSGQRTIGHTEGIEIGYSQGYAVGHRDGTDQRYQTWDEWYQAGLEATRRAHETAHREYMLDLNELIEWGNAQAIAEGKGWPRTGGN